MDKTSQKVVTKDPKRQERGKKSHEPTPSTPSHAKRSNDTYIYGVGILAVLAIGVCVFFGFNASPAKKLINDKTDQPPQRLHVFKKP